MSAPSGQGWVVEAQRDVGDVLGDEVFDVVRCVFICIFRSLMV